jgi:hypothetical protein
MEVAVASPDLSGKMCSSHKLLCCTGCDSAAKCSWRYNEAQLHRNHSPRSPDVSARMCSSRQLRCCTSSASAAAGSATGSPRQHRPRLCLTDQAAAGTAAAGTPTACNTHHISAAPLVCSACFGVQTSKVLSASNTNDVQQQKQRSGGRSSVCLTTASARQSPGSPHHCITSSNQPGLRNATTHR